MRKNNNHKASKTYLIYDISRQHIISDHAKMADTYFSRMIGLLGRPDMQSLDALILTPCNSIHTFGMKFPIDVLFLDSEYKICHLISNMKNRRISKISLKSKYVIELHTGSVDALMLQKGDQIQITLNPF